jgi:hypothetical protein
MKVICPEHIKTIRIDRDWRAEVVVRQTLVFLHARGRLSLKDHCAVGQDTELANFVWTSNDAREVSRRQRRGTIVIGWEPRDPIVTCALYEHEYRWLAPGSHAASALCTEVGCELKTGIFRFEIVGPHEFEAAIAFERPRWRPVNTERKLVKYALKRLQTTDERLPIADGGRHVEWRVQNPPVGARFIVVVFRKYGVALLEDEIRKRSLVGRVRQLFGRLAST